MRDSTVFRDLGLYLEREAQRFEQQGDYYWAGDLSAAAGELLKRAEQLAEAEPPLPSVASLAGIDPGFRPADQREVALRAALDAAECMWAYAIDWATPGTKLQRECDNFRAAADAAKAVLGEQGGDGSG